MSKDYEKRKVIVITNTTKMKMIFGFICVHKDLRTSDAVSQLFMDGTAVKLSDVSLEGRVMPVVILNPINIVGIVPTD